jgi:hypothetical protein
MSARIAAYIRQHHLGLVAIFLALSGTAYATHPGGANTISTEDIINNEIRSEDIRSANVQNPDLGNSAVTSGKIAEGHVRTADVLDDNLTGTDIANTDSLGSPEIGGLGSADITDDSLTGDDVQESSLNLDGFFASGHGDGVGDCFADEGTPQVCASANITLDEPAALLVVASGEWQTALFDDTIGANAANDDANNPDRVAGTCEIQVADVAFGSRRMGEVQGGTDFGAHGLLTTHGAFAMNGLTGVMSPGTYNAQLECTEDNGDIDWRAGADLSVVAVGA